MTKWILAAGAAALAMTSPVLAERGGQGGGKGGQQAAKAEKGGDARAPKADRGGGKQSVKTDRGGGGNQTVKAERQGGKREARSTQSFVSSGDDKRQARAVRVSDDRVKGRGDDKRNARAVRIDDDPRLRGVKFDDDRRVVQVDNDRFVRIDDDRVIRIDDDRFDRRFAGLGLIDGCPPGLAKKLNGCLPPGHANRVLGNRVLGNVFGLGAVLPTTFAGTRIVPNYYRDYDRSLFSNLLFDNDDYYYRYDNGYMYRIDRDYNIVAGLIPLLGGGYSIGQPYPLGFSAYNVPYPYRTYYTDNDDYYYRYGDGGIYQVDRSTGLIASIVSLLAGGLSVGQPLPLGYDTYNVPFAYRTTYFDTPDTWYRYNDGYIYGVDPRTRIVQNVVLI